MRTRLRLGAAAAVGLGALLLATVLASPALAWHSNVEASAKCLDSGKIGVHYTVTPWEEGHDATVHVFYKLDDGTGGEAPGGTFDKDHPKVEGDFELPEGTTGTVTVFAVAKWTDDTNPSKNHSKPVELPDKCKGHESTTTTTAPPTTAPPTTPLETTTSAAAGAAPTTTSGGGQLPFTGNSSGPMLLAGIVLVGGGSLFLLLSRARDGHATK